MLELLQTGLAKIRAHSTTWQLKAIKFAQRSIKKPKSVESDKQKLERLNVRALRCVYNKRVPLHGDDDYGLLCLIVAYRTSPY